MGQRGQVRRKTVSRWDMAETASRNPLKDWFRLNADRSFPAKADLLKSSELAKG